ncbi:transposase [Elizabethkingia anophelis]|nr:transposase [Elizabethkingia anophelis]MCT3972607.1 transposase [Elizabethkingia anophelis]MCT4001081.1 transposase [Elizabethkingia anophelis]MCT4014856.1 transposase [Elizabethkingia anophelis]MCT4018661.1 transposase [Elizabethkingia anophelis]
MGLSKYSLEFKLDCIARISRNHHSVHSVAQDLDLDPVVVRKWKSFYDLYGIEGLQRRSNRIYDAKFKLKVLETIIAQGLSLKQATAKFNIAAESSIINWRKAYEKNGILGLRNKPKGRPSIMSDYKPKKKKSGKPLTREEELLLENERLRAELDFLKKLDALTAKNNKQKPSKG